MVKVEIIRRKTFSSNRFLRFVWLDLLMLSCLLMWKHLYLFLLLTCMILVSYYSITDHLLVGFCCWVISYQVFECYRWPDVINTDAGRGIHLAHGAIKSEQGETLPLGEGGVQQALGNTKRNLLTKPCPRDIRCLLDNTGLPLSWCMLKKMHRKEHWTAGLCKQQLCAQPWIGRRAVWTPRAGGVKPWA